MDIKAGNKSKTEWVNKQVYHYLLTTGNRISDLKHRLVAETIEKFPEWAGMLASQDQSQLMKMMVQISSSKKGFEVGTFTGYSALSLAEGLPEDGKLYCLDVSEEFTEVGKKYWKEAGVEDKIELIIAPGVETLDKFID